MLGTVAPPYKRLSVSAWPLVRTVLGVLLVAAAGLKLYGFQTSAVARVGWLSDPRVEAAAAIWELALGAWLLSGRGPVGAWAAAVATFLAFAAVSGSAGAGGVADCGCFGAIKTSPWVAFGIDIAALALLAVGRPRWESADLRAPARTGLRWAGGVAAVLAILAGVGTVVAGSPAAALARLRGDTVAVADGYLDFGAGPVGERLKATATVRNWTDQPVRLVGGTSDCSCTTTDDLPITIPPGGEAAVPVELKVPASNRGQLTRTVKLWTDCPQRPVVRFRVGCRVE